MKKFSRLFKKSITLIKMISFFLIEKKKIKRAQTIFFFPFYHTGGAEKIHLQIVTAIQDSNTYVFFTKKSNSNTFLKKFEQVSNCYNISEFTKHNGFIMKRFVKYVSKYINGSYNIRSVFGCNTEFFYDILPKLRKDIKKIDLTHAFSTPDYGLEQYSLPFVDYLNTRVVINSKTKSDFKALYKENELIDEKLIKNILIIENGIYVDKSEIHRKAKNILKVGYLGRWSVEKRPELFLNIAEQVHDLNQDIRFFMAGNGMEPYEEAIQLRRIEYKGELTLNKEISSYYNNIDVILVTSYREGFPLVIMEAMFYGVIVIATNVGSIGEHITDGKNGFLIKNINNEQTLVDMFIQKILVLQKNRTELQQISKNAQAYAISNFGMQKFNKAYKKLLLSV